MHVDWVAIASAFLVVPIACAGNSIRIWGGGAEAPVRCGGVPRMHRVVGGSEVGYMCTRVHAPW